MELLTVFTLKTPDLNGRFFTVWKDHLSLTGIPADQGSTANRADMFLIALNKKHRLFY